jgi:hypothetical protein
MNGKNLIIYTDASNRFGAGALGLVIATVATNDISSKPIFELTCLNETEYTFAIDILR